MNSLGRNNNGNNDKQSIFTKETLGVVLILFTTLCLVCLITRESVFSAPGKYVNEFLFGCFGYFAYPITVFLGAWGVTLVTDKKIEVKTKLKIFITLAVVCIAVIWQQVKLPKSPFTYGEYLSESYHLAEGGISTCTAGGFFTALITYPIVSILSEIGTYVILGAIACLSLYIVIKTVKDDNTAVKPEQTQVNSSYVEQPKEEDFGVDIAGERDYPIDFASQGGRPSNQKLFVNNPNGFAFKTKKELSKEEGEGLKIEFSDKGLGILNYNGTYSQQYSDELKKKIEYVKFPAEINVAETVKSSYADKYTAKKVEEQKQTPTVSQPINTEKTEFNAQEIPTFNHEESKVEEVKAEETKQEEKDDATLHADIFNKYAEAEEIEQTEDMEVVENAVPDFSATENGNDSDAEVEEYLGESDGYTEDQTEIEEEQTEETESFEDYSEKAEQSNVIGDQRINEIFENPTERKAVSFGETDDKFGTLGSDVFASRNAQASEEQKAEEQKPPKEIPPINREYFRPPLSLLESYAPPVNAPRENHEERMAIIKQLFHDFNVEVEPRGYVQGPSITRYEVKMPAGFSVKKTVNYDDDLKTYLRTRYGVIIEAPIPGKDLVGIEVANESKVTVGLRSLMEAQADQEYKPDSLMFAIGKDIVGKPIFDNLAKGPHFLVAGATGSGKSVCLNIMIVSLIMRYSPEELRLILIDPKGVEFGIYEHIPHLMIDEIITEPKKALASLQWAINEMERRFKMLQECGSVIRDIESYNKEIANDKIPKMPRIVIVVDELSNLMETCKREMESKILSLAQKARSVGIHLVLATQRPSVDVITGVIKANLPSRIALKVMNFADSNTIISAAGAEKLLGNGDMLYQNSGMSEFERYQGAYISGKEVGNIVSYIRENNKAYFDDDLKEFLDKSVRPPEEEVEEQEDNGGANSEVSDLFLKCVWEGICSGSISISKLQIKFSIGYIKAAGIISKMESMGLVSANEGAKARRMLITKEQFIERFGPIAE